ncbi:hypothetical protein ACHAW5_009714 [Stephanodiscus triporus]|uniref:CW-type domain-containing protein n=1 Tax=Stephanodiscus triporus TaxID=2934178 RepID=A0ABD3MX36_9STRA
MSTKSQRREVHPGLRVKVRFVKKANVNGRKTRKLKWYGGVVYSVSNGGRRIKVHYDDGTNEASDFPDKDIIIDDRNNGRHRERGGGDEIIIAAPKRSDSQSGGGGAVFDDRAGGNETRKSKKKKKKKKRKRERLAAAKGEGEGGRPTSPYDNIDVGREVASSFDAMDGGREGEEGNAKNDDTSVINLDKKNKKKKKKKEAAKLLLKVSMKDKRMDSLSDMSIGSTDGGSGKVTEITKVANDGMTPLRCEYLVHGNSSSDEEGEEKDGEVVESKSSPFGLEGTDPSKNENEEDISCAQSNRYSPKIKEGKLPVGGGLQSKEMREGGHHAVKPGSSAQLKYVNKPQDEGLSDEAYTKSNQAAVANASDPPYAANCPPNAARSSSSSSGMDVADTVVIHTSSTSENEKTIGTADALVNVKLPSHAGVDELRSKQEPKQVTTMQEEQDETLSTTGKEESKKENISTPGTAGGGADIPPPPPPAAEAAMTANAEEHAQHNPKTVLTAQPPELKKKRGPLSIRIGLPGAKRKKQMEEEMKLKQQVHSAADGASTETPSSFIIEPNKKRQKISTHVLGDNERIGDGSINDKLMKDSDTSLSAPARSLDIISSKGKESYDNSISDGEIQEDGEIDENDTASDMKKTSETIHEDTSKIESSPPAPKKPKLVIKLNTKKRKQQQESKADEEAAPFLVGDNEFQQNADRVEFSNTAMEIVPPAERLKEGAADSMVDDRNRAVGAISPRSDDDRSNNGKMPNSTGSSASTSPVLPESGSAGDDGNAYSMARSGRKAAKRAAEKIAVKKHKPKKEEKHKKAEEDPWVQCDRCHKWRHLPGTVNLDSLPENWFCELNIYDPKRNSCEADEQTSKEVAKEKKRAKKLAIKKLQFEHAQAVAEEVQEETKPKNKMGGRSTSPKNDSDKETEFIVPDEKSVLMDSIDAKGKSITDVDDDADTTLPFKSKAKRGRPRRDDKEKHDKNKDEPVDEPKKQEWVQCEKCEKWRRLPPRISAEDLPDVWYCSMNTWDIHLATCTAIEDKHEASPARTAQYSEQSQIPTSFASSSKLSYRNLIFGSGRRQKKISERMRAQESLFSTQEQNDADMGIPPTVAYANSKVFFNKNLHKANSFDDEGAPPPTSIFDILSYSRVWQELNNNASTFHAQNIAHANG